MRLQKSTFTPSQSYKRVAPMSYQEMAFAPALLQQRQEKAESELNADQEALNFEYLQQDDPLVRKQIKGYQDRLDGLSKQLAGSGIGSSTPTRQDIVKFKRDYVKDTGIDGVIGQAQKNYKTAMADWGTREKDLRATEGVSEDFIQRNKKSFFGKYQGSQDEFGNYRPFEAGKTANYYNVGDDAIGYLKNAGYMSSNADLAAAMPNIEWIQKKAPWGGVYMGAVIKNPGMPGSSNAAGIARGLDELSQQYSNPNTDRGAYSEMSGMKLGDIQRTLSNTAGMMVDEKGGTAPSVRVQGQMYNKPTSSKKDSKVDLFDTKGYQGPNIPISKESMFKSPKKVLAAIDNPGSLESLVADDLIGKSLSLDMIPKSIALDIDPETSPSELYRTLSNKFDENEKYMKGIQADVRKDGRTRQNYEESARYRQFENSNKEIKNIFDKVKSTIDTELKLDGYDLAVPSIYINTLTKGQTEARSDLQKLVDDLHPNNFKFVTGEFSKEKNIKKLEGNNNYQEAMKNGGLRIVAVSASNDEGLFFTMETNDGKAHLAKIKNPNAKTIGVISSVFGMPQFAEIERLKGYRISGNTMTDDFGRSIKIPFNVTKKRVAQGSTVNSIYEVNMTNAEFYNDIIESYKPVIKNNYLTNNGQELSDEDAEAMILEHMGIDPTTLDWNANFTTNKKADVIKYANMMLNKPKQ